MMRVSKNAAYEIACEVGRGEGHELAIHPPTVACFCLHTFGLSLA